MPQHDGPSLHALPSLPNLHAGLTPRPGMAHRGHLQGGRSRPGARGRASPLPSLVLLPLVLLPLLGHLRAVTAKVFQANEHHDRLRRPLHHDGPGATGSWVEAPGDLLPDQDLSHLFHGDHLSGKRPGRALLTDIAAPPSPFPPLPPSSFWSGNFSNATWGDVPPCEGAVDATNSSYPWACPWGAYQAFPINVTSVNGSSVDFTVTQR